MRIAVLTSVPDQAELIAQVLAAADHHCYLFKSGAALFEYIRHDSIDMLMMDLQLPGLAPTDVIRAAQEALPGLPVLLLAAPTDEDNVGAALSAGADDYQLKPLRRGELALRVRTLLKRRYPERQEEEILRFGGFAFEPRSNRLTVDSKQIDVTHKEFALALLFFRNLGRPLSRAYIQENVWSREADIPSRTLDTHVSRIRNKLRLRPENGFRLAPVYSYGYKLEELAM